MWTRRIATTFSIARSRLAACHYPCLNYSSFYEVSTNQKNGNQNVQERSIAESKISQILPFSVDEKLRADYLSFTTQIRVGKLLENMDIAAGTVAYNHVDPSTKNFIIVTASCDRLQLQKKFIRADRDVLITGRVNCVWRSSMEIQIDLTQDGDTIMSGYFSMAARDPVTFKSKEIPKIKVTSPEEEIIFKAAQERKRQNQASLDVTEPPTVDERLIIHELYLQRKNNPTTQYTGLADTRFDSTRIMHPREQNIHGHVFGGYIMRSAYELAYLTACNFVKVQQIELIVIDDIKFIEPVKIGEILQCSAMVTYTDPKYNLIQVSVQAKVLNPVTGVKKLTNVFQITFRSDDSIRLVNPVTYAEGMQYLAGRRSCYDYIDRLLAKKE